MSTIAITSANTVAGHVGVPLSFQFAANQPFSGWSLVDGSVSMSPYPPFESVAGLPPGLSFNPATGLLSGTPTTAGVWALTDCVFATFTVGDPLTWSSGQFAAFTITITLPPQTITPFTATADQCVGGPDLTITPPTSSSGLAVVVSVLSGPATLSGTTLHLTGIGTVVLAANQAGNGSYAAAPQITTSFQVVVPTIALSDLSQIYTGSALPAAVTTNPAGLAVTVTYNGSPTVPTAVGTYAVEATITDSRCPGGFSVSGTLAITIGGSPFVISCQLLTFSQLTLAITSLPAQLVTKYGDDYFVAVRFTDPSGARIAPVNSRLVLAASEYPGGEIILQSDGWMPATDTLGAPYYLLHIPVTGAGLCAALKDNAVTGIASLVTQLLWDEGNPFSGVSGPRTLSLVSPFFSLQVAQNLS